MHPVYQGPSKLHLKLHKTRRGKAGFFFYEPISLEGPGDSERRGILSGSIRDKS